MTCKIECKKCGRQVPCSVKLPWLCGCGHRHFEQSALQQVDAPPGLPKKLLDVTTAYTAWLRAGRPMRDLATIKAYYAICQACPLFKDNVCTKCGCACTGSPSVFNKIALETETCPLNKWPSQPPQP